MYFTARYATAKFSIMVLFIYALVCLLPGNAHAQKLSIVSPSKQTTASAQQEIALDDPLGRSTPQGTLLGFMKNVNREDYEQAAEYLDTKQPPRRAQQLANQLQSILNKGLSAPPPKPSNKPEGNLEDGLKPNRELIGTTKTSSGSYDILLERIQRNDDPPVWLFSSSTLKVVPEIYRELGYSQAEKFIPQFLRDYKLLEYPVW